MQGFRKAFVGGFLSLVMPGLLLVLGGCGEDNKENGAPVAVNKAEQEQHNKAMMDFMQSKGAKKADSK